IGTLVSLLGQRLAATVVAFWVLLIAALGAVAGAPPDSTWTALKPVPHQGRNAVFALAVDPSNNQALVAGTSDGSLLRSTNGGSAWAQVHAGKSNVTTVNFSPYTSGLVLAGTRGGGALASRDGGATWSAGAGREGRNVRGLAVALTLVDAGHDHRHDHREARGRSAAADRKRSAAARRHQHRSVRVRRQWHVVRSIEWRRAASDHRLHAGRVHHRPSRPLLRRERWRWIGIGRAVADERWRQDIHIAAIARAGCHRARGLE